MKNSGLDWILVVSESDKTFSFRDVFFFDFTLVSVTMVTSKEYGLDSHIARSYRQYSKHSCKPLCERDISRLTPVKKMRLSIPCSNTYNIF